MSEKSYSTYKYSLALTSQVFFCSIPIRLDTYNRCQFDCSYCFAKSRNGQRGNKSIQAINPSALENRLKKVQKGIINSALDEFLSKRIPIQMGGMSDPLTKEEQKAGKTLKVLKILSAFNYPTIFNSKGAHFFSNEIIDVMQSGNFYVRFSISHPNDSFKRIFEKTTASFNETLNAAENLANRNIPVGIRFQPLFPGFENDYLDSLSSLKKAGVKHVSVEYLKVPSDRKNNDLKGLENFYEGGVKAFYKKNGAVRLGREYCFPTNKKVSFFKHFKTTANRLNMLVGLADNEFLHFSDGGGCCSGAMKFLKKANIFQANVPALLSTKKIGDKIYFSDLRRFWRPQKTIGTSLNSSMRIKVNKNWEDYLIRDWNQLGGLYSPSFFYGVEDMGKLDGEKNKVYILKKGL